MGRRKGSRDDIFELVEIRGGGGRSAAVECLGPPRVDFQETHRIAYLAPEMPNFAPKKKFQTL